MTTDQLPNESAKAYAAFKAYCEIGPQRSIPAVSRNGSRAVPTLKKWSRRHKWQERVKEWDASQAERMRQAEDEAMKASSAIWAKRQIEHREKSFKVAEALLGVAIKELEKIRATDRVSTLGDVSRSLQIVETLKRLSLGLATEKTELSGPDNTPLAIQSAAPVVIVLESNDRDIPKN